MEGPLGPVYSYQAPIWYLVDTFSWINIGFAFSWVIILFRKWSLHRSDKVVQLQLMTVVGATLGQTCILIMTLIWPSCRYPYIHVVPPTHHCHCGATIAYRLSNIVFFMSMGTFNMAVVQRFQPAYSALGLPYAKRIYIAINVVIWSITFVMTTAAVINLIRKNTEELELYDLHSAISLFEEYTPLAATGIMGSVNMALACMGIKIIVKSLKQVKNEFSNPKSKGFQSAYYFRLTFGLLVSGVFSLVFYGLCWLRNIPFFDSIPMVVLVNLRVFLCLLYMSLSFVALDTFIKAIRLQQNNLSNLVTSTWIQHDLGPVSQISHKAMHISSADTRNTRATEENVHGISSFVSPSFI
jgi:hypothetical protein